MVLGGGVIVTVDSFVFTSSPNEFMSSSSGATTTTSTRTKQRPPASSSSFIIPSNTKTTTTTALYAVSALVRKAKEAELRKQIKEEGIQDDVMEQYKIIQEVLKQKDASSDSKDDTTKTTAAPMGPLQANLTRRKGTITVIAEYKRKIADGANGYIRIGGSSSSSSSDTTGSTDIADDGKLVEELQLETNAPELLSAEFREFGAGGIAILADERMGGCNYKDLQLFVEEQRRAHSDVPGPVPIINSDIIIDEVQIAQSSAIGVQAITLDYELLESVEEDKETNSSVLGKLAQAAHAVRLEIIIAVRSKEEVSKSIDIMKRYVGAGVPFMISVVNTDGVDAKVDVVEELLLNKENSAQKSEQPHITLIANILHQADQGLAEVEETWALRDKGFHVAWISDALYKAGNDALEHPGAIIKSMAAKSSVRWASPVAKSGRGEGATEYLGDIMM